ncbi:methyltransferase domain-containing protein, partial [Pseudacidovorax intermedius]|uniref:methyltransferase domain-containing protein n=1 Tax=Pseudacidovorax intermedius TaxID=433924 RepID=UPI0018CB3FBB
MNTEAVEAATEVLVKKGMRVFNAALFAPTEREHVAVLLALADLPEGSMVIDAGCGVGEMALHMRDARPDLDILLVNMSAEQLARCPEDFHQLQADFDHMGAVPDGAADAIIFSYSICHSPDWPTTLREARRVLKDGGVLLINDLARLGGDNAEFERLLGARAHEPEWVEEWATRAGFRLDFAVAPEVHEHRLREVLAADGADDYCMLESLVPTVWRFVAAPDHEARWIRHRGRVGFQFSGGRDSTAALYLLRDRWADMTIYHLDTGDQFPETREVARRVRADVEAAGGRFEVIETDVRARREAVGFPSDLVPVDN